MIFPALSRGTVDRDAALREDETGLAAAWERARVLVVEDGRALVADDALVLVAPDQAPLGDRLYLGCDDGGPYFAVAGPLPEQPGAHAATLRDVGALLDDRDAGLLVHAVALTTWHAAHPHCPRCGARTVSVRGGSVRECTADGSTHFPRTDPAAIVLVHDGADRCVLGRQPVWPPGRYSILAGFVEPGESVEQAVVREVREESGLEVVDVAYAASQPWPFPSSLMLGYTARCPDPGAVPRSADAELEDVRWFTRAEVQAAGGWAGGGSGLLLPPEVSIASRLIAAWAEEG
ncbi:MAG: NAD(+) diphosphatase [Actinomycetota bacterium]|nr:NAD(+) diphosphatase [Actinomycetota bacterium]